MLECTSILNPGIGARNKARRKTEKTTRSQLTGNKFVKSFEMDEEKNVMHVEIRRQLTEKEIRKIIRDG
ncbi:hypothetical protein PUN28_006364 [Cardiocondyla obscurior]|uniref:Ribosomal protein S17 n=1 Tax=Cardiocondyla obscurior TaxID=286306 RepID=A0AAW2G8X0_9HYME